MKTRFTVFTSMVFLLGSMIIATPATAQRRTSNTTVITRKSEQKSNSGDSKKKITVKKEVKKEATKRENVHGRRTSEAQQQRTVNTKSGSRNAVTRNKASDGRRVNEQRTAPVSKETTVRPGRAVGSETAKIRKNPAREDGRNIRSNINIKKGNQPVNKPANLRARTEHNKTVYRLNPGEQRYKPAKNFRGNNNNWSANRVSYYVHHSKRDADYFRHYDHRKYKHWDHEWEHYRWSVNSWRDYYSGYHPQSYLFHKHYFYHPAFGHVIKKFNYKPVYFVHNNIRYYNYNGHFFRHFKGVGYVLADMPYGIIFKRLPAGHERVYVNGYLYFRVGNLFFESNPRGYALIHYPERYYALDSDYYNGGYFRALDFSIHF